MTDCPSLEDLDEAPEPARWCCNGNAEDCALCTDPNPPYPFLCPGHPRTAGNERIVGEATEATELDKGRRYLVPVGRLNLPNEPDLVHLSLYQWLPQFEAWATGLGLCGTSTRQGALSSSTEVTCPGCLKWKPVYEQILEQQAVAAQARRPLPVPDAPHSPLAALPGQVRAAVRESGLKQKWIADRLHVSEKHLSQLMTGRAEMTLEWAQRILGLCGMELVVSVRPRSGGPR